MPARPVSEATRDRAPAGRAAGLVEAALRIAGSLDLDETLHNVVEVAREHTGAAYAALAVLGADRRIVRFVTSGMSPAEIEAVGAPPAGRGILGALIDDPSPLRLADLAADPRSVGFPPNHPPMRSFIGVPILAHGEVFGNLYLTEAPSGEFGVDDEHLLQLLALQAGVAVANAHAHEAARLRAAQAQRAVRARDTIARFAAELLQEHDAGRVLRALAEHAMTLVDASVVAIAEPDEAAGLLRTAVAVGEGAAVLRGRETPIEGSVCGTVLRAAAPVRLDDLSAQQRVLDGLGGASADALVCVPMLVGEEPVAVLTAYRDSAAAFDDDDTTLLASFATLGGVALHTARAFGRERARAEALATLRRFEGIAEARQDTLRRVVEAQEQERRRIAQDLHDHTAGALASVLFALGRLVRSNEVEELHEGLRGLRVDVAAAIEELRDLIADLRPKVLDDFGLEPALERLCATVRRRSGLRVHLATDGDVGAASPDVATAAYRIVQEALHNIVRHSGAGSVTVSASVEEGRLQLVIEDDGRGLADARSGYGLDGMRERARMIGGTLDLEVPSGGGTRVRFEAPL
jgi:signal transduction histidine kinase